MRKERRGREEGAPTTRSGEHRDLIAFEMQFDLEINPFRSSSGTAAASFPLLFPISVYFPCRGLLLIKNRERERAEKKRRLKTTPHLALQHVKDVVGQVAACWRRHRGVGGLGGEARVAPGVGRGVRGELAVRVVLQFCDERVSEEEAEGG